MGTIQIPGRVSGRTYNVNIKGDSPSETEKARISAMVEEREATFAQRYSDLVGKPLAEPDDGTALGRGIARGMPQAKSALGTTVETIGQQLGLPSIANFGRGMEQSAEDRLFQLQFEQPAPTQRQDVTGIGSALTYLGELAGEQAPQLGIGLAGGAAGAVAGGLTAGPVGAVAGFGVGSGLTEAPMLFGSNVQRQEEEVAAGRKASVDLTDALEATVGQAALTSITNALGGAGIFLRPGAKLFTRVAAGAATGATTEGLNEIGQQVLERHQAGLPVDSPDAIQEYIDSGIAGGVLGGGAGGVGGIAGPRPKVAAPPAPAAPTEAKEEKPKALPAPAVAALPAPGTSEPVSAANAPTVAITPAPPGAVSGGPTSNVPRAMMESLASEPQLMAATQAIEAAGEASTPVVQKALGVSYPAAQGILKKLEGVGVVSPAGKNKKRKVTLPATVAEIQAAIPAPKTAEQVSPATVTLPEEVTNVQPPSEAEPAAVGVSAPSGAPDVAVEPVDSNAAAAAGAVSPEAEGLGGNLPSAVDTGVPEGGQPDTLTAPTPPKAPSTTPRLTATADELTLRDAEKAIAPMRQVREIADNSALQSELNSAWDARFADKPDLAALVQDYATPDALVAEDPTTADDKRAVLSLFKPGAVKKGKKGQAPAENAQNYFSRFKRPIDALEFMVADATLENQRFKNQKALEAESGTLPAGDEAVSPVEREFFEGMSAERAKEALAWVEANMSPQAQVKVRELQRKYRKAQEAKVPMRATSSLPSSTAIGGRSATLDEKLEFERELDVQAKTKAAQRAETKSLVSLGGKGLDALLGAVQETKAPVQKRAVGMRKMTPQDQEQYAVERIMELKFNQPEDVQVLDTPLHPAVVNQLRKGNLELAIMAARWYAPSARVAQIAKALQPYVKGTTVRIETDLRDEDGTKLHGQYVFNGADKTSEVLLDADSGLTFDTLLHELMHAATVNEVFLKKTPTPMRARLEKLFNEARPLLGSVLGTENLMEFVAEAFSNPAFQAELAALHPKGRRFSAFDRFLHEVTNFIRRIVGLPTKAPTNALDVVDQMVFQLMTSPIDSDGVGSMRKIATPEGATVTLNRIADMAGSFPPRTAEFAQEFGDEASRVMSGLSDTAKRGVLGFMGMQAVADVAKNLEIEGAYDLQMAMQQLDAASIKSDSEVDSVLKVMTDWLKTHGARKPMFDKVVTQSTRYQVDPALSPEQAKKKYGSSPEKMRVYADLQKDWNAIGPEGRSLYNLMRALYRKQYLQLRKALEGKIDIALGSNPELASEVKKSIYAKFFDMNKIEPYFPLARKGDFWLEYSAFDPETNTTEPVKEVFESPRARDRAMAELQSFPGIVKDQTGKPVFNLYTSLDIVERGRTPDSLFVKDTISIIRANLANQGVSKEISDEIQQEITRMFVEALPETSFARSLQRRKGTKGYIEDSFEAFRLKAYSLGRQGVRHTYSNRIRAVTEGIRNQGKNIDDPNKIAMIRELVDRADFATNPPHSAFEQAIQTVNRAAFTFTIGFNVSSALVNLASIPTVVAPYLAGRYGIGGTALQISNAYKLFLNSGMSRNLELPAKYMGQSQVEVAATPSIDNYFVLKEAEGGTAEYVLRDDVPEKLRAELADLGPLVDVAAKNGQLNRSIFYDSIGAEEVGRSRGLADKFAAYSGFLFHNVERANRQVALVAAYKLELARMRSRPTKAERGLTDAQMMQRAAESAVYQTTETSGGATLATASRFSQKGIGRAALMFKNYGLTLFYLQMKLAKQVVFGSKDPEFTPEMRQAAFKQLLGIQLSSFALAGVSGVPVFGGAAMIANAFLGDDEEDAEMITRRYLGEGLYKGFLSEALGVDISSRIGLTGLLIRENRYNTNPSAEETLVATLGGPAWSTTTKVVRGVNEFAAAMTGGEGDMVRGIENMLPASIGNFVKSARIGAEGGDIETRRGDLVTGDLGALDLIGQAIGFKPNEASLQQDLNQLKVKISKAVVEKRSKLSRRYYIAARVGDIEGMKEALNDIRAFNEDVGQRYPEAVIDSEFLNSSLKSHQRTTDTMDSGVSINPVVRDALRDLSSQYNKGLQLF